MAPAAAVAAAFAAVMDRLGPFEPRPHVAVAVSGGADSMAACLLTRDWVGRLGGAVLALVIDHGLRPESREEARSVCARLADQSIPFALIRLEGLARGPGLAARARDARHAVLEAECARRGIVHLVFGHHAADQAETVAMRMLARSAATGLSGMAALVETQSVRRLRPLLGVAPADLRAVLVEACVAWVEDPSNADATQQRARLRALRADPGGRGPATRALVASAAARGADRATRQMHWGADLARRVAIYPSGHAVLAPGSIAPEALAELIAMLSGSRRVASLGAVGRLAAAPHPATLGGVRLLPAGRLGPGLLLVREQAAMADPVPARRGAVWDGRFRLIGLACQEDATLGAWGADAPRDRAGLPQAVLQTLPALRVGGRVVATGWDLLSGPAPRILFAPAQAGAGAPFFSLPPLCG